MKVAYRNAIVILSFLAIVWASCSKPAYKVGDTGPAGGIVFYDKGSFSDGWRYMECAPVDQSNGARWGAMKTLIKGALNSAIGTGASNTKAIIEANPGSPEIAAKAAADYRGGGKDDWFLPSKDELNLLYLNLRKAGLGGFDGTLYWASTDEVPDHAWYQYFNGGDGMQSVYFKDRANRVRPIRAF
jgi:hypothetical protein